MSAPTLNGVKLDSMTGRCFLLDTNVLLHDANALEVFDEHNIILTVDVLEELDHFKKDKTD